MGQITARDAEHKPVTMKIIHLIRFFFSQWEQDSGIICQELCQEIKKTISSNKICPYA